MSDNTLLYVKYAQTAFAGFMTAVSYLFGAQDQAFTVFALCVAADVVTGVIKGIHDYDFSSKRMREGFATKLGYFIVIFLAVQLDRVIPVDGSVLRTIVIWFYIATEASSILENLALIGVPIPQAIIDRLAQVKGKAGKTSENGKDEK
jgi:toxin secretion/phage lysis holin